MAETIEDFVRKLQTEGVQAGQAAAGEITAKARREADQIVRQAEARASQIVEDAEAQAQANLAKGRTELQLAARDTALRLREALGRAVRAALAAGAKRGLDDPEFLRRLLSDIILQYAQADREQQVTFRVNVTPDMQAKLADWALHHLHQGNVSLDLKGTLAEAGFEYQVEGARIEVTLSSVVDALSDLVSPTLREMLEKSLGETQPGGT